jgi:ABC-2 type transport system ATP-binding protein
MPVTTDLAIDSTGLVKRYGARAAVDGVNLVVRSGSVHGLLGPNGAGKTTLLRMLLGLVRPDAGELLLFGHRGTDGRRALAGWVDSPRFHPYLTGFRSLEMLASFDRLRDHDAIDAALARVGLDRDANLPTGRYSLGMRQRLGIAAALIRRPRMLILDEPANGLDPAGARDMRHLIRRLAADGLTVLLSSHVMADVEALCDDVTILHHGRVAYAGPVSRLRESAPAPTHRMRTSDDVAASRLAPTSVELIGGSLRLAATPDALDAYVLALGRADIAVRALATETTSLEAAFFRLTEGAGGGERPVRLEAVR